MHDEGLGDSVLMTTRRKTAWKHGCLQTKERN